MALVVSPAVAEVADAAGKLRADDAVILDADRLLGDIETLLGVISGVQAVVVHRLRAAIEVDATVALAGRSPKRWLVEEQLLTGGEAGRLVKLARQLPGAAVTEQALEAGEINTAHAAAVLTALASLPPDLRDTVEPHLVDRAQTHPPEEIARFTDDLLDGLGLDEPAEVREQARHASRGLDLAETLPGTCSISGTLTGEVGAQIMAALETAGITAGITGGRDTDDDRTPRQRRHDALGVIADGYLAHGDDGPPMTGAPRTVIVTMDLATLQQDLAANSKQPTLNGGQPLTAAAARRLACDAGLVPAVLGGRSEVLDIGQADHAFTVAIRRAAYLRDEGRCAFPNCRTRVAELHHIVFRRNGGPTSLQNAAWLCTFHHYLAHDGGWTLTRTPTGYQWTDPAGRSVHRHLGDRLDSDVGSNRLGPDDTS